MSLEGNGSEAKMVLSRNRMDFATVPQGESQRLQIAIQNAGSAPLDLTSVKIEGRSFAVSGDDCSSRLIVSGGDCELVLRFQPDSPGAHVGALIVDSPVGQRRVPLSGLAGDLPVPRASVDQESLSFEATASGSRSPVETLTLTSHGPGRLEIQRILIEDDIDNSFRLVPATCQDVPYMVAGSRCTIGVRFQPSSTGGHRATLSILSNADPARLRVALRGESSF